MYFSYYWMPMTYVRVTYSPANIYWFKVNNKNIRKRCTICSKLTIKTPERRQWRLLVFLLWILKIFYTFKQVNAIRKNIFACLFSVHNTISLHVMFNEATFREILHPSLGQWWDDGRWRSISRKVASLNILAHGV